MAEDTTQNPGISRRDLIKRGAILGGAVAWATPVVQVVGMSPAFAATISEGNCCLRVEITDVSFGDFDGDADKTDVRVRFTGRNCSNGSNIKEITLVLEERLNGGDWFVASTKNTNPATLFPPGNATTQFEFREDKNTGATVQYRLSGTFKCQVDGYVSVLPHTFPQPYETSAVLVVPAP